MTNREVLEPIRVRQSARSFTGIAVPDEAVGRILDAGRRAPSGANRQPWHFVVVRNAEVKRAVRVQCEAAERIHHAQADKNIRRWYAAHGITAEKPFLVEAPVLIATFFDPRAPYAVPSVWIAIAQMLIQTTQEGFCSLPYTPSGARVAPILGVPEPYRVAAVLPIGEGVPLERQPRRPLAEVASIDRYGEGFAAP